MNIEQSLLTKKYIKMLWTAKVLALASCSMLMSLVIIWIIIEGGSTESFLSLFAFAILVLILVALAWKWNRVGGALAVVLFGWGTIGSIVNAIQVYINGPIGLDGGVPWMVTLTGLASAIFLAAGILFLIVGNQKYKRSR